MSTHSSLSPSARHRWSRCPGSVREEARYPSDASTSPAAIDGTHSHTLLEHCITDLKMAGEYVGQTLEDREGTFVVDAERAKRVQVALDYITANPGDAVLAETRVDPQYLVGRADMRGTADVTIWAKTYIEIIDYKDGIAPVTDSGREQLEQYALGVLSSLGGSYGGRDEVRMTIIQPKLAMFGGNPITTWTMPLMDVVRLGAKLRKEASATDDPNAPLIPGELQCKYCKHKGACAALANDQLERAGIAFDDLQVAKQAANTEPTELSDDKIREIVESAPLLRSMLEAVEQEALRRMKDGKTIEGLKVVRGRGSRSWALPEDQMAIKLQHMGLPKSAIWETKLISPAKAEKVTWTKKVGGVEEARRLSERQLKTLQGEYVAKSDGKLTVAPASDPREPVVFNVSPMFAPVDTPVDVPSDVPSWLQ